MSVYLFVPPLYTYSFLESRNKKVSLNSEPALTLKYVVNDPFESNKLYYWHSVGGRKSQKDSVHRAITGIAYL